MVWIWSALLAVLSAMLAADFLWAPYRANLPHDFVTIGAPILVGSGMLLSSAGRLPSRLRWVAGCLLVLAGAILVASYFVTPRSHAADITTEIIHLGPVGVGWRWPPEEILKDSLNDGQRRRINEDAFLRAVKAERRRREAERDSAKAGSSE